ncbi:PAS domain-containing protein [Rheinheimera riviphila]|uniref:histidine kinase n=1 Tax=Rheinheimera riviphila TaxID=1834037 RepID=A0A437R4P0_9GAMM|nr:ATP-binding protein [Rheinheimera riviphila]RVU41637.1 PAS domain-containing protein [Rheinheimera riviphila]
MKTEYRLRSYLLFLHGVLLLGTVSLYQQQPLLMLALELLLAASFWLCWRLCRQSLQPLRYTECFQQLLSEQSYNHRLHANSDPQLQSLVQCYNDLLARLQQERLRIGEQQGLLDQLLEASPVAVLVFDFDDRLSLLNASARQLLGLADPLNRPLCDWIDGDATFFPQFSPIEQQRVRSLLPQLQQLLPQQSTLCSDSEGRRFRCQCSQFIDRGFSRRFLLIEELTAELHSSEKSTFDKLVRVIAHEVNNTVAVTGSVLQSVCNYQKQLQADDQQDFAVAIAAVQKRNHSLGQFIDRCSQVVKMPAAEPQPTDLVVLLSDVMYLCRDNAQSRGVQLQWQLPADPVWLLLDPALFSQAILNIVKNALEAAETGLQLQPTRPAKVLLSLVPQPQGWQLSVTDSGDLLRDVEGGQLFTPFFTTKKGGQGIGLVFVREVLQRHGLPYRLASTDDQQSCFEIWFSSLKSS